MTVKEQINLKDPFIIRSAAIAKALGHPARIAILKILAERNTCFCGDITEVLPLAQSTVSQHLKALKSAGLIDGEVEGVRTCYCLNPDGIQELKSLLFELSDELIKTCC
ncbi:MAG: metalloregulator ArsR/SmtB family transcription factor [Gracilimonas sp.]